MPNDMIHCNNYHYLPLTLSYWFYSHFFIDLIFLVFISLFWLIFVVVGWGISSTRSWQTYFLKGKVSISGLQAIRSLSQLPNSALVAQKQPGQYINKCLARAHNLPTLDQDLWNFLWNFIRKCMWLYNFKVLACLRRSSVANIGQCWLHFYVILRLQLFSLKIL